MLVAVEALAPAGLDHLHRGPRLAAARFKGKQGPGGSGLVCLEIKGGRGLPVRHAEVGEELLLPLPRGLGQGVEGIQGVELPKVVVAVLLHQGVLR